jgi:excisionase family DNA binding protein
VIFLPFFIFFNYFLYFSNILIFVSLFLINGIQNMKNNVISFDNLPEAVGYLIKEISEMKEFISQQRNPSQGKRLPVGIDDACKIIGKAKPTVYSLVQKRLIPCYKVGKKLYFYEDELLDWIAIGRKKSIAETKAELEKQICQEIRHKPRKLTSGY